jgi:hypothetical protein
MNNQSGDLPLDFFDVVLSRSDESSPSLLDPGMVLVPFAFALRFLRALVRFARSEAHDRARKMNLKNLWWSATDDEAAAIESITSIQITV